MWFIKNRKGIQNELIKHKEWKGIAEQHYRDKKSCIIYVSEDYTEIYVDTKEDDETISTNPIFTTCHPLIFAMISYLKVTKILLKNNKRARKWLNSCLKANFVFCDKPFGDYFLDNGEVNWKLVVSETKTDIDRLIFVITDDTWKWYCPLDTIEKQLGI